jgi:hypothetical protein
MDVALVPEDLGGGISGSGVVDLTLVADALGSHVASRPPRQRGRRRARPLGQ